jgi:hypothetical protein
VNPLEVDTRGWEVVGSTANSRFFHVEPGVLAALPLPGTSDDKTTALENTAFQINYFKKLERRGVVLVFADGFTSQDKDARRIYLEQESEWVAGAALIAASLLGRAIASLSLGIRKSKVNVKMFRDADEALPWARECLKNA